MSVYLCPFGENGEEVLMVGRGWQKKEKRKGGRSGVGGGVGIGGHGGGGTSRSVKGPTHALIGQLRGESSKEHD